MMSEYSVHPLYYRSDPSKVTYFGHSSPGSETPFRNNITIKNLGKYSYLSLVTYPAESIAVNEKYDQYVRNKTNDIQVANKVPLNVHGNYYAQSLSAGTNQTGSNLADDRQKDYGAASYQITNPTSIESIGPVANTTWSMFWKINPYEVLNTMKDFSQLSEGIGYEEGHRQIGLYQYAEGRVLLTELKRHNAYAYGTFFDKYFQNYLENYPNKISLSTQETSIILDLTQIEAIRFDTSKIKLIKKDGDTLTDVGTLASAKSLTINDGKEYLFTSTHYLEDDPPYWAVETGYGNDIQVQDVQVFNDILTAKGNHVTFSNVELDAYDNIVFSINKPNFSAYSAAIDTRAEYTGGIKLYIDNVLYTTISTDYREDNITSYRYSYQLPIEQVVGTHTYKLELEPSVGIAEDYIEVQYGQNEYGPDFYAYPVARHSVLFAYLSTTSNNYTITRNISPVEAYVTTGTKPDNRILTVAPFPSEGQNYFKYAIDGDDFNDWDVGIRFTLSNLSIGNHEVEVKAAYDSQGTGESESNTVYFTTSALSAVTNIRSTRQGVNQVLLQWNSQQPDTEDNIYEVSIGGNTYQTNNTSIAVIVSKSYTASIIQKYLPNDEYNSLATTFTQTLSALPTPVLSITNNKVPKTLENVLVNGSVTTTSVDVTNTVTFRLNYTSPGYSLSGVTFRFIDTKDNVQQPAINQSTNTLTIGVGGITAFQAAGNHKVTGQLVFTDEDFNSEVSTAENYGVNTLSKPAVVWGYQYLRPVSLINESFASWLPTSSKTPSGQSPDYYIIDALVNNNPIGKQIILLQPNDTERMGLYVIDPDPKTGVIRGLIQNLIPAGTVTLATIRIRAMSFDEWYIGGSLAGTLSYTFIQLGRPQNVQYDVETKTLSWDAFAGATDYNIYDNDVKIDSTTNNSYTFDNLELGLHKFRVTTLKQTFEEV